MTSNFATYEACIDIFAKSLSAKLRSFLDSVEVDVRAQRSLRWDPVDAWRERKRQEMGEIVDSLAHQMLLKLRTQMQIE